MARQEKADLMEYLHGLVISDYITRDEEEEILEDYDRWNQNELNEEFYLYDGNEYSHTIEYDITLFNQICAAAKTITDENIKVETDKYFLSITVNNVNCFIDMRAREFYITEAQGQKTDCDDFIEALAEFFDTVLDGSFECEDLEKLHNVFEKAYEDALG